MSGGGPKKEDYAASQMEATTAAIAAEEQRYFEGTYQPLLKKQRDLAGKERLGGLFAGTSQADVMQAFGPTSYMASRGLGRSADVALASISQQLQADTQAVTAATARQLSVTSAGVGQGMTATNALAQASKLQVSKGLAQAAGKQQVRMAKNQAIFDTTMALVSQGTHNIGSGGSFFKGQASGFGMSSGNFVGGRYQDVGFWGLKPRGQGSKDEDAKGFVPYKYGSEYPA